MSSRCSLDVRRELRAQSAPQHGEGIDESIKSRILSRDAMKLTVKRIDAQGRIRFRDISDEPFNNPTFLLKEGKQLVSVASAR